MYYFCNVLYCSELQILVYKLIESDGVQPKHVVIDNKI
jgi:hypothetical protein